MTQTLDHVLLYPEDIESEKLVQAKCTQCGCLNAFWPDLSDYQRFMEKGYGLTRTDQCISVACTCHRGNGKLPRIITRKVSIEVALGKPVPFVYPWDDLNG